MTLKTHSVTVDNTDLVSLVRVIHRDMLDLIPQLCDMLERLPCGRITVNKQQVRAMDIIIAPSLLINKNNTRAG